MQREVAALAMVVVVLVVVILDSASQSVKAAIHSHGSIQEDTIDFCSIFQDMNFMPSSFVKELMQLKHDSGTFKTGASLQLIFQPSLRQVFKTLPCCQAEYSS